MHAYVGATVLPLLERRLGALSLRRPLSVPTGPSHDVGSRAWCSVGGDIQGHGMRQRATDRCHDDGALPGLRRYGATAPPRKRGPAGAL